MSKRVAFVISGAAAFIPQELALARALTQGLFPAAKERGPVVPSAIAGTSSGSLTAIALNATLQAEAGRGHFTWDVLEQQLLFPMRNSSIFRTGLLNDLLIPFNMLLRGFILNTAPLVKTLQRFVAGPEFINYQTLGQTFLPTHVSAVDRSSGLTKRFFSRNPLDAKADIVEVLLGSTAIPIAFPERTVAGFGTFVDGGTGTDNVPVEAFANDEPFDELYVIAPDEGGGDAKQVQQRVSFAASFWRLPLIANISFAWDVSGSAIFPFQLFRALSLVKDRKRAFLYMPRLKTQYSILDFNVMKPQFEESLKWARKNNPQPIIEYLNEKNFPVQQLLKMVSPELGS